MVEAAREAERSVTEIRLYKQQAQKAELEAEQSRSEIQELKQHSLQMESQRGQGTERLIK